MSNTCEPGQFHIGSNKCVTNISEPVVKAGVEIQKMVGIRKGKAVFDLGLERAFQRK